MLVLLVLPVIFAATFCLAVALKSTFAKSLPSALFALIIVMYVFGMVNALFAGFVAVLVVVLVSCVAVIVLRGPRETARALASVPSPALVIFVVYAIASFALTRNLHLASWDEFTHWGAVVKATVLFDSLSPYNPADLAFRSYPPTLSIFEYFVQKIGTGWNEGNLFWGYQLLFGSLFIPFAGELRWRHSIRLLVIVPLMALTPLLVFNSFGLVLVDPFLGMLFGYGLALVYTGRTTDWRLAVHLSLALAALVLTKDVGVFFAAVILVLLLVKSIRDRRPLNRNSWRGISIAVGIPIAATLFAYLTWKTLLSVLAVPVTFAEPIDLSELAGLANGGGRSYWPEVLSAFLHATTHVPLSATRWLLLSHAAWFALAALALIALELCRGSRWGAKREYATPIVLLLGAVAYTLGLLVLYLFRFTDYEAVRLASFDRYLGAYWLGISTFVTLCAIALVARSPLAAERLVAPRWRIAPSTAFAAGWLIVILLFVPTRPFGGFVLTQVLNPDVAASPTDAVVSSIAPKASDKVWIISEYSTGYEYWRVRYALMPAQVQDGPWSIGTPRDSADVWTNDLTPEEWRTLLEDYDFVVIERTAPGFSARYGELFDNPTEITDGSVFKVVRSDGELKLVLID